MSIRPIVPSTVSFKKSKEYKDVLLEKTNFYMLNTDEKLNVIYDTLTKVDDNCSQIQQNQKKNNFFNYTAFKTLAPFAWKEKKIDEAYLKNK